MSHDPTISEPARRVIITISHQFNKEIERSALRDRTGLTDSELLAILHELVKRGWVEHTGYPGSPSGDTWKMTSLGQSAQAPSLNRTQLTLFTEPDGTVVLRPRRSPRLACSLGIVSLLSAFLLWGAVAMGWQWAALLDLVVFSGIWIALLIAVIAVWTQVTCLTSTTLIIRAWYGKIHKTPRESIARITRVHLAGRGEPTYLFFLDTQGRFLSKMFTANIPLDSLEVFARQLGVPFIDDRQVRSPGELRRKFPGSLSWAAQPVVLALIIVGVIFLAIIIAIVIVALAGGL